ncbi:MAG: Rrf2 family transcriptional regulator [FCB group bacterium]|nr:Rrf2 family transcriptional regulator [FCB group bacterium]
MLYSKSAEYAIQAMIYLAEENSPDPIMISRIAKAYNIPQQFLAKISQTLVKHRLLIAVRGRNGGVKLARPANEIYLNQIVHAVDGPPPEKEQCVIGLDYCSDSVPCPLHHKWKVIREDIREMLGAEDLAHLAKRVINKREQMVESFFPKVDL